MKVSRTILIAVLIAAGLHAADYVPGELIVKLEHEILDPGSFEGTLINLTNCKELTILYYTVVVTRIRE